MSHDTHRSTSLALTCLTAIGLMLPAAAFAAEEGTRMPGSACKLGLPQAGDTTLYAVDEIYNSSDKTVNVTCPIARNVIDSGSLEYASVLTERGVTCTLLLLHPGSTDTDMNPADGPSADAQRSSSALGRFATPEDIANAVVFLAGEGARSITGTSLLVDGGSNA